MNTYRFPVRKEWKEILKRPTFETQSLDAIVKKVLDDIKANGDKAVKHYTNEFDKVELTNLKVSDDEFVKAEGLVNTELKEAIAIAIKNITLFHSSQRLQTQVIETMPGVRCWQKSVAIEKVGLYVPGGTAPLFSSVLMLAIPANIAGCNEIVLCTPPAKNGSIPPAILYAAKQVGISAVFKIGGIQAIAAMAYGTETIPAVYKIFGPGNQYVTAAKQLVTKDGVSIDMPAGPSEVAVMADETCNPAFVASDLLSQAEHGKDSQVILVTDTESIVEPIMQELNKQLDLLPRKELAIQSLKHSKIIIVKDKAEMIDIINEYAPEHLIIATKYYMQLADKIINAGSVFLGNLTPESAGDYASGTNHTLPTNGWARSFSGVNLDAYVKKITYQEITSIGLSSIGKSVEIMASTEQLDAHKNAMTLRIKGI